MSPLCHIFSFFLQFRRVQAQGIHLSKLIYLSEKEFKYLKFLRAEFLKRTGNFFEEPPRTPQSGTKRETQKGSTKEGFKGLREGDGLYYEPTNIQATRDSLFWGWRRVKEYYRDIIDLEEKGERKRGIRIDPQLRRK